MLEACAARDRAIRRAIETGELPNMDLIHASQRAEGHRLCFGRAEGYCPEATCRWWSQCMDLATFERTPRATLMRRHRGFDLTRSAAAAASTDGR